MCGLTGIFVTDAQPALALEETVTRMSAAIVHRGPDDSGAWVNDDRRVALGFRRLSILDLSAAGHQPMVSASGRFTVVFNGELYNHLDLRRELGESHSYRGHSDTETLLAAFERWGIAATVGRLAGMFAIAVWDAERRTLSLVRDRFGKKPLYLYRAPGVTAFASELGALRGVPGFAATLDPDAVASYLRYLYVPAPASIFKEVRKLRPGHILTLGRADDVAAEVPYWTPEGAAAAAAGSPWPGSDAEAIETLDDLLGQAVSQRLLSDVPVGALLSGGIDSSLVVGVMAERSAGAVRTYAVAFPESAAFDESAHAKAVAAHFGTTHTTFDLSTRDLLDVVPRLPELFDEPHADPSCVPTYLISALTRRDVTVALTGDGGDEIFAGYNRYRRGAPLLRAAGLIPFGLRRRVAGGGDDAALHGLVQRLAGGGTQQSGRSRDRRLRRVLRARTAAGMYEEMVTSCSSAADLVPGAAPAPPAALALLDDPSRPIAERMMLFDQMVYLPDDLLAKLDRASMAASLEARAPLLDHRIAEFAWRLPLRLKIRRGRSKWILRELLARRLPRALFERPKMGFSSPIDAWLRGPLRAWADGLLGEAAPASSVLDSFAVRRAWQRFQDGGDDSAPLIWALAVFRAWEARWIAEGALSAAPPRRG